MSYRLTVDLEAVEVLRAIPRSEGNRVAKWMERLRSRPFTEGAFTAEDFEGRDLQVSEVGRFLVYHWSDHLVKTVRVTKIEVAE